MGIVIKQSIWNSVYTYFGLVLGAINTLFLFPYAFEDAMEYYGLIQTMLSYTLVISTFSALGAPQILVRFFHRVKEEQQSNLGFFALLLPILLIVPFSFLGYFFRMEFSLFFTENTQDAELLSVYFPYLLPMVLFNIYFELFSSISIAQFKSVTPLFLKEVERRIITLLLLLAYSFDLINIDWFIGLFTLSFLSQFLIILFTLVKSKLLTIKPSFSGLPKKELLNYGFFSFLTYGGDLLINRIDIVMIGKYVDLESVAFYSIAYFIGMVINTPSKAASGISRTVISKSLENNDFEGLHIFYKKSSLALLIATGWIFILVVGSMRELYEIIPSKFQGGVTISIVIGLGRLFNGLCGINGHIITLGKYYRMNLIMSGGLLITTLIANLLFIPKFGILGAGIASTVVVVLNNVWKLQYVWQKHRMSPYTPQLLFVSLLVGLFSFVLFSIELHWHPILIVLSKSLIASVLFGWIVFKFNYLPEFNSISIGLWKKYVQRS